MSKPTSAKLQLRAPVPQALQVNKPVVLVIIAVVAFIVIFSIVSAFDTSVSTKMDKQHNDLAGVGMVNDTAAPFAASLKNLPQGYQDIAAIKKYAASGGGQSVTDLQKEFELLKQQDAMLRQEVEQLMQHPGGGTAGGGGDANSEQARSAAIFFSGVSPPPETSSLTGSSSAAGSGLRGSGIGGGNVNTVPTPTDLQVQKLPASAQTEFYNKQNMLGQKLAVLKASDNPEDIYDLHNVVQPVSPYEVQAGSIIPAVLLTGINTSLAGTVVAQSRNNIYDTVTGKYLLIPRGSRIVGEYDAKVAYGQRRVLLTFSRIIRPDGSSVLIGKPTAADLQGQAGMEGNVDNHWGKILAAATLSTILSVGAGVTSDNSGEGDTYYRSSKQDAILGAAGNISQIGTNLTNRAIDIQPTITLNPGYQFNIIVRRDMVLSPYQAEV